MNSTSRAAGLLTLQVSPIKVYYHVTDYLAAWNHNEEPGRGTEGALFNPCLQSSTVRGSCSVAAAAKFVIQTGLVCVNTVNFLDSS